MNRPNWFSVPLKLMVPMHRLHNSLLNYMDRAGLVKDLSGLKRIEFKGNYCKNGLLRENRPKGRLEMGGFFAYIY